MTGLAQRLNCVVVFLHHIGKDKQEEGQASQVVHRGRGGSSYSSFSHAIFNLVADSFSRARLTLECGKIKGERFEDTVMDLDLTTRWFVDGGTVVKQFTPYEQVLSVFNGEPLKRAAIREMLPDFNARTLDRHLKDAVEAGELVEIRRGTYQKTKVDKVDITIGLSTLSTFQETLEGIEDNPDFDDSLKNNLADFEESVLDAISK